MIKCVQMSSVHHATDNRIYHKECQSLVDAGYDVTLIAVGDKNERRDGIQIQGIPEMSNRLRRMTQNVWRVFCRALRRQAKVYHFHDPELIPAGLLLKMMGKRVVYDAHEDLPRQLLSKFWIPGWARKFAAVIVELLETWAANRMDAIVAATPTIARRFCPTKTVVVCNYPRADTLLPGDLSSYAARPMKVAYVGGFAYVRGIREMMEAVSLLPKSMDVRLVLAGWFNEPGLEAQIPLFPGYERTEILGPLSKEEVAQLLGEVRVGLVTLHPIENYLDALPVKLFEYMAAGLPVIASDFPLWRSIVESAQCGLLVAPLKPRAIADAIQWVLERPDQAVEMGRNGRAAILDRYNWGTESEKLLALYGRLAQ